MEQTYVELLTKLKEDVATDVMPEEDRKKINQHLDALYELLWKYSA